MYGAAAPYVLGCVGKLFGLTNITGRIVSLLSSAFVIVGLAAVVSGDAGWKARLLSAAVLWGVELRTGYLRRSKRQVTVSPLAG